MMRRLPSLEDMSLGQRIALTMIIALVILFAFAAYGFFSGGWQDQSKSSQFQLASEQEITLLTFGQSVALAQGQPIDVYAGIPPDTKLLALDKQALEQAYTARLIRLFDVWLSSTQGQDPTNFQNGLRIARRGYILASDALARREQEIERQIRPRPDDQK